MFLGVLFYETGKIEFLNNDCDEFVPNQYEF